eukprot:TRINITY_DN665_c2_g2_i2.p1 TRINITY_DN665_c2_g2~~TRINITY_DN665_c2_g2_i2.p1  ORF type:complete len:465 (-),score=114.76 TRINITY_DN665_c2_g2_i2:100-1494(-)
MSKTGVTRNCGDRIDHIHLDQIKKKNLGMKLHHDAIFTKLMRWTGMMQIGGKRWGWRRVFIVLSGVIVMGLDYTLSAVIIGNYLVQGIARYLHAITFIWLYVLAMYISLFQFCDDGMKRILENVDSFSGGSGGFPMGLGKSPKSPSKRKVNSWGDEEGQGQELIEERVIVVEHGEEEEEEMEENGVVGVVGKIRAHMEHSAKWSLFFTLTVMLGYWGTTWMFILDPDNNLDIEWTVPMVFVSLVMLFCVPIFTGWAGAVCAAMALPSVASILLDHVVEELTGELNRIHSLQGEDTSLSDQINEWVHDGSQKLLKIQQMIDLTSDRMQNGLWSVTILGGMACIATVAIGVALNTPTLMIWGVIFLLCAVALLVIGANVTSRVNVAKRKMRFNIGLISRVDEFGNVARNGNGDRDALILLGLLKQQVDGMEGTRLGDSEVQWTAINKFLSVAVTAIIFLQARYTEL